jgi:hypothetical protein
MFESDADDRPPTHDYTMKMAGLSTATSLFLSVAPSKCRATVADPSCNRMPGWAITVVVCFPTEKRPSQGADRPGPLEVKHREEAQLLTHLKLSGHRLGFLMNGNVARINDGIQRMVNGLTFSSPAFLALLASSR